MNDTRTVNILSTLREHAKAYRTQANESIARNRHMNNASGTPIPQQDIDALLVDFINYIGFCHGVDFGLYTNDIQ